VGQWSHSLDDTLFQRLCYSLWRDLSHNFLDFVTPFLYNLLVVLNCFEVLWVYTESISYIHSFLWNDSLCEYFSKTLPLIATLKLDEEMSIASFLRYAFDWQLFSFFEFRRKKFP
jgi:hypothetical protein